MVEESIKNNVRTRIAPSPTGEDIHIGTLYIALLNYSYAKRNKGSFIIRIEDTDRSRLVEGSENKMLDTIKNYGLAYDEGPDKEGEYGPYRQSDRLEIYQKYAKNLLEKGAAYYCFCTKERLDSLRKEQLDKKQLPKYDKHCLQVKDYESRITSGEPFVIRLNILPNKKIWFDDVVRGRIEFDSSQIDDQVLLKSDGYPTYHLGVVVDDYLMKITHVVRGEEWISSTPKHIVLYEAFGWEKPIFAHVPLLRNSDHTKLSKRKNPVWASWYLDQGFLKEAILNFLALMGWSHPEQKEIFSLEEFIRVFDIKDLKAVGPVFDINKLTWMNGVYIREMDSNELKKRLMQFDPSLTEIDTILFDAFLPLAKSRMKTLQDFKTLVAPFLVRFHVSQDSAEQELKRIVHSKMIGLEKWNKDEIASILLEIAKEREIKFPLYYKVIFGISSGLPLADVFEILGKEKTLEFLS